MFLGQKDESDFSALELKILELIQVQSIEYFPILKAIVLQENDAEGEDIAVTVSLSLSLCWIVLK